MKKRHFTILTISFVLTLFTSCVGQSSPAKVDKNDTKSSSSKFEDMVGIIEEMPRFPACEDQKLNNRELEECSKSALLKYIYDNLEYPDKAKKEGLEGRSIIQFQIDVDGSMKNVKLARGFDEECDEAALKIIQKMQSEYKWVPGKQRGRLVKVQYTIPIQFKKSAYLDPGKELPIVEDAPPPPQPPVDDKVFRTKRNNSSVMGCKNKNLNNKELEECKKEAMLKYIHKNLVYPEEAKKNCTEGMVVVQFVVGKCGDKKSLKLIRDIGDGCGQAALDVVNKMLDECIFNYVKQVETARGRPSKVQYTIPVKFKL